MIIAYAISIGWFVPLVLAIAAAQLVVVFLLRRTGAAGPAGDRSASPFDETSANQIAARLRAVAGRVAADAGEHNSEIVAQSQELKTTGHDSPDAMREVVYEVAGHIVKSNEKLQVQLQSAIQRLDDQAEYIRSQSNEARTDVLTGLSNRRAFDEIIVRRFSEWERTATPLSLIMFDIDHFKQCNDEHGHQAGDAVLRMVAATLLESVRDMDVVARYGGEEFAVILPTAKLDAALKLAERIRRNIQRQKFRFKDLRVSLTASLGIAEAQVGENAAQFIGHADAALYAAKKGGRNCCWYHDGEKCRPIDAESTFECAEPPPTAQWSDLRDDLRRRVGELAGDPES